MQLNNVGTPTINLVGPVRYTHAHNGVVNRPDCERMVDLVVAMLVQPDAKAVAQLRDFAPAP